jgi:uncharacterized protein with HEPN domain
MRSDPLLLQDILQAAIDIQEFISGITQEEFVQSKLIRAAIVQKLIVIGEAASRLSDEMRRRHPNVPWREIRDFRNIAVHNYASIDDFIVWQTAIGDCPSLQQQIGQILGEGKPE